MESSNSDFVKINNVDLETVDMLDCSIDIKDKETPIVLEECFTEVCRFFQLDAHLIYIQIIHHVQEMLKLDGMVTDSDKNPLDEQSEKVKAFFDHEKIKWALNDQGLVSYLYENLVDLENAEKSGWTKYYDYPDLRVYYKAEEGEKFGSIITDTVVKVGVDKLIAVWDNVEIFKRLMPEFYDIAFPRCFSNMKTIMTGKQAMPWPLYHRDMVFQITGFIDHTNKALCTLQKSIPNGSRVMNFDSPPDEPSGMPRLEMSKGYNLFQSLGPNKSRHVQVMCVDPKVGYLPKAVMDGMMKTFLYGNMRRLQRFCLALENKDDANRVYYERKLPHYRTLLAVLDDQKNLLNGYTDIQDCPDHPANPNCKDHDPEDRDFKGNDKVWYFGKDTLELE